MFAAGDDPLTYPLHSYIPTHLDKPQTGISFAAAVSASPKPI